MVVKLKRGGETGTIDWDGLSPNFVTLRAIPKSAKVSVGDTVVTSQTSSLFPAKMVGTIKEIVPDSSSNFYTLKVDSLPTFSNIEYVYVIDNTQFDGAKKTLEDSTRKKVQ